MIHRAQPDQAQFFPNFRRSFSAAGSRNNAHSLRLVGKSAKVCAGTLRDVDQSPYDADNLRQCICISRNSAITTGLTGVEVLRSVVRKAAIIQI